MSIDAQIRESALAQAIVQWVQDRLFTQCVPTGTPLLTIDHLDTLPGSVRFSDGAGDNIDVRLTIVAYAVTEPDLRAHPNDIPDGARNPLSQSDIRMSLGILNQVLAIVDTDSDPSPGLPPPIRNALKALLDAMLAPLIGTPLFNLAPIVAALGSLVPAEPSLGRAGGVVALRFGATGAFVAQLDSTQTWGVFLDADEMVGLLSRQIPDGFPPVRIRWEQNDGTWAIVASASATFEVWDWEAASVTLTAVARPSFIPDDTLRLSGRWDPDLTGVAVLAEKWAIKFVRGLARRMLPWVHFQNQTFFFDVELPQIPVLLGAQPEWANVVSGAAGITIGGPVRLAPTARRETLDFYVYEFGRPDWWGHCRELAKAGDGSPPKHFTANDSRVRVQAGVSLYDGGALCGVDILPPNGQLRHSADVTGVGFDFSVGEGRAITDPVQVIVRTARGVRFIDLGVPDIHTTDDGWLDVQVNYINDCLFLSGPWLKLALGETVSPEDLKPPPLEDPSWIIDLHAELGLNIHLVTIDNLDPGELLTVTGAGQLVQVRADDDGVATVPGLVPISDVLREVILERASGRDLDGTITVRTTELTWLAEVGPADTAALRDLDGTAVITRIVDGDTVAEIYEPDGESVLRRIDAGDEVRELQPQPLPPTDPDALGLAAAAGLDAVSAHFLPGLERRGVALATLPDGQIAVVSRGRDNPREVGRYAGPTVGMHVAGGYAIGMSGDSVHLFAVERPQATKISSRR